MHHFSIPLNIPSVHGMLMMQVSYQQHLKLRGWRAWSKLRWQSYGKTPLLQIWWGWLARLTWVRSAGKLPKQWQSHDVRLFPNGNLAACYKAYETRRVFHRDSTLIFSLNVLHPGTHLGAQCNLPDCLLAWKLCGCLCNKGDWPMQSAAQVTCWK